MIRRRQFIAGLAGSAAWSLAAQAQQTTPAIGFLLFGSVETTRDQIASFLKGLAETGYVEGRNVAIEYRWADNQFDRLPGLAADLVRRRVKVMVAISQIAASAAKAATRDIPIVFLTGVDPVETGLVVSLQRPDRNLTGVTILSGELAQKRLELLRALVPTADFFGYLINPTDPVLTHAETRAVQAAAQILGVRLLIMNASTPNEIEIAFDDLTQQGASAVLLSGDGLFMVSQRDQIVALAARNRLPTIYDRRNSAAVGGLLSYGTDTIGAHGLIGTYTGRVLNGEKPADLPVQRSTKVELIINLKTANALGLTIPLSLLGRADEVFE
jgi:putative tryptophan/tyrosine transport system substrate-binding protein